MADDAADREARALIRRAAELIATSRNLGGTGKSLVELEGAAVMADRFIVAEISKNWPSEDLDLTLGELFERLIARNLERGYELHSWRVDRWSPEVGKLNELIIAVFELVEEA